MVKIVVKAIQEISKYDVAYFQGFEYHVQNYFVIEIDQFVVRKVVMTQSKILYLQAFLIILYLSKILHDKFYLYR